MLSVMYVTDNQVPHIMTGLELFRNLLLMKTQARKHARDNRLRATHASIGRTSMRMNAVASTGVIVWIRDSNHWLGFDKMRHSNDHIPLFVSAVDVVVRLHHLFQRIGLIDDRL